MPLVVIFLFPSPPPSYTSPFSDLWALLLSRVLKESLSYWTVPIFSHLYPAVWLQRKELLVLTVLWRRLCPSPHSMQWVPALTASAHRGFMILTLRRIHFSSFSALPAVLWALLLHIACVPVPARFFCSHLLTMSCGAFFAEEKVIGK